MNGIRSGAAVLAWAGMVLAAGADVILLKDGKRIEGAVKDTGATYEVTTAYGTLSVTKSDVARVVPSPDVFTREAEVHRAKARALYDEAAGIEGAARNAKLDAGLAELERAKSLYNEAREIFTGDAYDALDRSASEVIQEMRLYRDKKTVSGVVTAAKPPEPPPARTEPPAPAPPSGPAAKEAPVAAREPKAPAVAPPPSRPLPKTPEECLAALSSPDPALRAAAAEGLGAEKPSPDWIDPLLRALSVEREKRPLPGIVAALVRQSPASVLSAIRKGLRDADEPAKRNFLAWAKAAGTDGAIDLAIDIATGDGGMPLRAPAASVCRKHAKKAVPRLRAAIQGERDPAAVNILLVLAGLTVHGDGGVLLAAYLGATECQRTAARAVLRIGRPAVPHLLAVVKGNRDQQLYAGALLRRLTGTNGATEWNAWWAAHRMEVEAEWAERDRRWAAEDYVVREEEVTDQSLDLDLTVQPVGWPGGGPPPGLPRGRGVPGGGKIR